MQINETFTAKGYTPAAYVAGTFGTPRNLDGIVIHHWGATGQTHEGVVDFFVNGPGLTSAHFVASAGKVHCLVSPEDAAWHSGNAVGNATTIGIECRPEATAADYQTVAELVAWLRDTYGRPLPLSPHREWQATACPGVWDLARIDRLSTTATPATPAPATTTGDPLAKLTDKEQQELLAAVREIRGNVKDINTDAGTGKLSLRQAIANIRAKVGAK